LGTAPAPGLGSPLALPLRDARPAAGGLLLALSPPAYRYVTLTCYVGNGINSGLQLIDENLTSRRKIHDLKHNRLEFKVYNVQGIFKQYENKCRELTWGGAPDPGLLAGSAAGAPAGAPLPRATPLPRARPVMLAPHKLDPVPNTYLRST